MSERFCDFLRRVVWCGVLAASALVCVAGAANAALITPGAQITDVPATLIDPFGSLTSPLPQGQFLLPIGITAASDLQEWSFDLTFDASVVMPFFYVDALYFSVYQAEFNAVDPTSSEITSSGLLGTGVLEGIAGFSSGVSGDGLLAFVLFEYLPGQSGNDPNFGIGIPVPQPVPEPGTMLLLAAALLLLGWTQCNRGGRLRPRAAWMARPSIAGAELRARSGRRGDRG